MRINVRSVSGETYKVDDIDPSAEVAEIKAKLAEQLSLPPRLQRLIYAGHELLNGDVVSSLGLKDESMVYLVILPMRIKVRSVSGETYTVDDINPSDEVASIKAKLQQQLSVPPPLQRLIYAGRELLDGDVITSLGLKDDSIVHLVVRQAPPEPQQQTQDDFVAIAVPSFVDPANISANILLASLTRQGYATLQLARMIKMFSIIDCIFLLLLSLGQPLIMILVALPVGGYLGATYFRVVGLVLYIVYILMNIAYRAYLASSPTATSFDFIINALGIVLEVSGSSIDRRGLASIRGTVVDDRSMSPDQMRVLVAIERGRQ